MPIVPTPIHPIHRLQNSRIDNMVLENPPPQLDQWHDDMLYGIETTSELQLVYQDIRDKRNAVLYALQKMQSSAYEMDHLLKVKEKVLQKIIRECEKWRRKSWKEAEAMTPRFFERIDVHQGYFLDYRIVPEIKQFLPVTQRLGDKSFSSNILHARGCQTVLPTDASAHL